MMSQLKQVVARGRLLAWVLVLACAAMLTIQAQQKDKPKDAAKDKPAAAAAQQKDAAKDKPAAAPASATKPVPKDAKWMTRHEAILANVKKGNAEFIFVGDSITQGWEGSGKKVWEEYYGKRNAVNLGISGDRTQHVLWRLDNGEIDGIKPKAAVIMIGTNNSKDNTAEEIADGIKAIVEKLRTKLPDTKILLLAIFPRAEKADAAQRVKNAKASEIASKLADGKMVFYLDIGKKFLKDDGTLTKDIMPDFLHPNAKGYQIWSEAMEPELAKLVGPKP
ncbi:MAG: platelet-activating factor acetylhydrolase IB subunit [Candidatus Sumerlaeota bacterium]|nr:platelet-activating factor acetylhydrolase IB subunit [Candidatus Sumerlaeota bacterium]